MTLFDVKQFSEITSPDWNFTTLRPPLRLGEVLWDFRYQWRVYCQRRVPFPRRVGFLVLRVVQRLAYNWGWICYHLRQGGRITSVARGGFRGGVTK